MTASGRSGRADASPQFTSRRGDRGGRHGQRENGTWKRKFPTQSAYGSCTSRGKIDELSLASLCTGWITPRPLMRQRIRIQANLAVKVIERPLRNSRIRAAPFIGSTTTAPWT